MTGANLAALEKKLSRRFRVVETRVTVGKRSLALLHPASAEDLIDEEDFERDERLPYWAELWPSSMLLAERMLALKGGGTLLELGCGSGLVATCAALAGFDVVASDYYDDALQFARVNAWRNGAALREGLLLDWRALPIDLPRFDVVVASDVLYERPYGELVARAVAATLAPGGVALVADPGRVGRESFLRALPGLGAVVRKRTEHTYRADTVRQTITIFEIVRRDARNAN